MNADERIEIVADGEVIAACSLWWKNTPAQTGYIGKYECDDERAAQQLFAEAKRILVAAGCATVVGPIDGDTWHRYRLVTHRGERAAFQLEPANPDAYVTQFEDNGFKAVANYFSAEERLDGTAPRRTDAAKERLSANGITIRKLDAARFDVELCGIHAVANRAFAGNAHFTPIEWGAFAALYEPFRTTIDPRLVRIAERHGEIVAFAFGYWDGDAIVGKTQARLPGRAYAGVTSVIIDGLREEAASYGARTMIHALIADSNVARNGTMRNATPFRKYSLFGAALS